MAGHSMLGKVAETTEEFQHGYGRDAPQSTAVRAHRSAALPPQLQARPARVGDTAHGASPSRETAGDGAYHALFTTVDDKLDQ